jgi:hypothetical protein
MPPPELEFRLVPGVIPSAGRGAGFLEGDEELNAGAVFAGLQEKAQRTVKSRMDYWVAGFNSPIHWFHGFPNDPDHDQCFVFKWDEKRVGQRLYGFLCNPLPLSNRGFRLCVLCIHVTKTEKDTDLAILDRVNDWKNNLATAEAIAKIYPERGRGGPKWKN